MIPGSIVERVIIHRADTGAVVAFADITSVADAWADASITPVVLSAGVQYVISSAWTNTGGSRGTYRNHNGLTFSSAIGSISYRTGPNTVLDAMPTGGSGGNSYAFARFLFT